MRPPEHSIGGFRQQGQIPGDYSCRAAQRLTPQKRRRRRGRRAMLSRSSESSVYPGTHIQPCSSGGCGGKHHAASRLVVVSRGSSQAGRAQPRRRLFCRRPSRMYKARPLPTSFAAVRGPTRGTSDDTSVSPSVTLACARLSLNRRYSHLSAECVEIRRNSNPSSEQ
jgi:hypothetical protein